MGGHGHSRYVDIHRATNGHGLFATRLFRTEQVITQVAGRIVSPDSLWELRGDFADNCFRFGPETYLDPGNGAGRYLNHSCEPNAGIRKANNQLFLFAARMIRRHEEILIDYSTILGDDDVWTMRCRCGSRRCRKVIRRVGSLPPDVRDRYIEMGMIPRYILGTMR